MNHFFVESVSVSSFCMWSVSLDESVEMAARRQHQIKKFFDQTLITRLIGLMEWPCETESLSLLSEKNYLGNRTINSCISIFRWFEICGKYVNGKMVQIVDFVLYI